MTGENIDIDQILEELGIDDITHRPEDFYYDATTMKSKPEWLKSEENLRVVPRRVAVNRLGKVFSSAPQEGIAGNAAAMWGSLNAMARASLIYVPGAGFRYIGRNYIQNMVLLATTNPGAFQHVVSGANRASARGEPGDVAADARRDRLLPGDSAPRVQRACSRTGAEASSAARPSAPATSARSSASTRTCRSAPPPTGATPPSTASRGTTGSTGCSTRSTRTTTPRPKGDQIRQQIGQQTRDDMIDFDALSPEEKQVLARYLFIWPFVRGFTKWPAMYLREYPGRVGAAGALAQAEGVGETEPEGGLSERYQFDIPEGVPLVGGHKASLEWLSPTGGVEDLAQSLAGTATALSRGKLTAEADPRLEAGPAGEGARDPARRRPGPRRPSWSAQGRSSCPASRT